ncbi:cation:proton antiporter subunit C [Candidatus Bipolaricaulota bacterium]|nr:cation:proton antiporter subunit C [Candidatus Bipolaricaulota bacterium]
MEGLAAVALAIALVGIGFWTLIVRRNLIWKLLGLNVAAGGAILFLVALAHRPGARPPIVGLGPGPSADPLPHALVLTAIVIDFATLALALVYVVFLTEHRHTQDVRRLERDEERGWPQP